jgi:hypothetical protein
MVEDGLFEPYHDKESNDDEEHFVLNGTFQDVLEKKGLGWSDFYEFVGHKIVWTGPSSSDDCAIVRSDHSDPPEEHKYSVDFISCKGAKKKKQKLEVTSASSAQSTCSTINGLLLLCSSSTAQSLENETNMVAEDVTLKCFATNPRQLLGTLEPLPKDRQISCLRLHFVTLDASTCKAVFDSNISFLELRQCTLEGIDIALQQQQNRGPRTLTISCTMPELANFAAAFRANTTIQELSLILHFGLQGAPFIALMDALRSNIGLEKLSIEYLDITDDGWVCLCESLHGHSKLRSLQLGFTEKFGDTFRRLDPERRTARTKTVLELVQSNTCIQELTWPEFQRDESLQSEIEACLESNRRGSK